MRLARSSRTHLTTDGPGDVGQGPVEDQQVEGLQAQIAQQRLAFGVDMAFVVDAIHGVTNQFEL